MTTASTYQGDGLLADRMSIVVTGSLAAKVADRTHARDEIRPVQVVDSDGLHRIARLDHLGEHGVGALLLDEVAGRALLSDGARLWRLDLGSGDLSRLPVAGLEDVHEIERSSSGYLVANTGKDEIVRLDHQYLEVERVDLGLLRTGVAPDGGISEVGADDSTEVGSDLARPGVGGGDRVRGQGHLPLGAVDRFHANQAIENADGRVWVLVHHVAGYQLMRKVATKVLKVQGDGGLVSLRDGRRLELKLTAPHSLTRVGDRWWVFDSGRSEVRIYTDDFVLDLTVQTSGWGRGCAVDEESGRVYAGMSPIRRRYLGVVPGRHVDTSCEVEVFDLSDASKLGSIVVPDMEQINNVYLVSRSVGDALKAIAE